MSEREQVWRERIEWQQWSGLTVAECCEEAGVSVASFYRWKKLLTEPPDRRRARSTRRTEVQTSVSKEKRSTQFVPIALRNFSASSSFPQTIASVNGSIVRIELPNGVVIHVSANLDGQRLGDVIIAAGQIHSVYADRTTRDLPQHEVSSC